MQSNSLILAYLSQNQGVSIDNGAIWCYTYSCTNREAILCPLAQLSWAARELRDLTTEVVWKNRTISCRQGTKFFSVCEPGQPHWGVLSLEWTGRKGWWLNPTQFVGLTWRTKLIFSGSNRTRPICDSAMDSQIFFYDIMSKQFLIRNSRMTHYLCPACGSVSEVSQACATIGCSMIGTDMVSCSCDDGLHGEVMNKAM